MVAYLTASVPAPGAAILDIPGINATLPALGAEFSAPLANLNTALPALNASLYAGHVLNAELSKPDAFFSSTETPSAEMLALLPALEASLANGSWLTASLPTLSFIGDSEPTKISYLHANLPSTQATFIGTFAPYGQLNASAPTVNVRCINAEARTENLVADIPKLNAVFTSINWLTSLEAKVPTFSTVYFKAIKYQPADLNIEAPSLQAKFYEYREEDTEALRYVRGAIR